jgi:hypothetical protein
MFLVELVVFSGARQGLGLVELVTSFASCALESAVACGLEVFESTLVFLTEKRVVWRWKVFDKVAMAILLTFVVPVTAKISRNPGILFVDNLPFVISPRARAILCNIMQVRNHSSIVALSIRPLSVILRDMSE